MASSYRHGDDSLRPDEKGLEEEEEGAITMLQGLGADFFTRDREGRGLLHAAARGEAVRFKKLLDLGLDASMEDDAHQTPIDVAAACGNTKVLELFEKEKK